MNAADCDVTFDERIATPGQMIHDRVIRGDIVRDQQTFDACESLQDLTVGGFFTK